MDAKKNQRVDEPGGELMDDFGISLTGIQTDGPNMLDFSYMNSLGGSNYHTVTIGQPPGYGISQATMLSNDFTVSSSIQPGSQIQLTGEHADININGMSLRAVLQGIQDQLAILQPDPELEADWQELQQLRERYNAKLSECREKSQAWKALKKQS